MQVGSLVSVRGIVSDWSFATTLLGLVIMVEPDFYKKSPSAGASMSRVTVYWDDTTVTQDPESYLRVATNDLVHPASVQKRMGSERCTQHESTIQCY